jgi:hypothetical protein
MTDDFVVARNPDEASTLPFLVRIPLGRLGVVPKVRDTWPHEQRSTATAPTAGRWVWTSSSGCPCGRAFGVAGRLTRKSVVGAV